jgi:hypothetical protein
MMIKINHAVYETEMDMKLVRSASSSAESWRAQQALSVVMQLHSHSLDRYTLEDSLLA